MKKLFDTELKQPSLINYERYKLNKQIIKLISYCLTFLTEISNTSLKTKYYGPSMNLLKTFNTLKPNYLDLLKDKEKNNWLDRYLDYVLSVLAKTDKSLRSMNFTNCQIAAVFEIFYSCFCYLAIFSKINLNTFLEYFRQTLLLYTVKDLPECLRIFNAVQAFDVAKLFHEKVVMKFDILKNKLVD